MMNFAWAREFKKKGRFGHREYTEAKAAEGKTRTLKSKSGARVRDRR